MDFKIIIYIIFGILPSLTWLSYYLRKDVHPESNRNIIMVFLWGAMATAPVFFIQIGAAYLLERVESFLPPFVVSLIFWFLIISFTEEFFKYLVIKKKIINNKELDEPLDIMLYMIISALGFAALENILYLISPPGNLSFQALMGRTMAISFLRFIGATFLHTLCSGLLGYFLAVSFCETKRKTVIFLVGLFLATLLHGLYDFSIMTLELPIKVIIPLAILVILAIFMISWFEKLKKLKSVCKI
ncbi:MAG: PrsW family intramembrane metalloprotease [Candidatus Staskawiczbacteria bacterium]|nr:PrsW family intramembrane metalloprotease [Candidatus Staskawiczbacteria bacterium]